jgi:hypothetical protein
MTTTLSTDFDDFLFSPVGEGATGMPLTVLSVLARLDLDPWAEAADLVRLPLESATQRLASLLAQPQVGFTPHDDAVITATRLVKLLQDPPRKRARPSATATATALRDAVMPAKRNNKTIYYLFAVIFMLVGLWAMAVQHSQIPVGQPQATSAD